MLFVTCILIFPVVHRHTAIVVHGKEFFFSGEGINSCPPVSVHLTISFPSAQNYGSCRSVFWSVTDSYHHVYPFFHLRLVRPSASPTPLWIWASRRCLRRSSPSTWPRWSRAHTGKHSGSSRASMIVEKDQLALLLLPISVIRVEISPHKMTFALLLLTNLHWCSS